MTDPIRRKATYQRGVDAENRCVQSLTAAGWQILEQRARNGAGEIDIIALDGETVVFIEVKFRKILSEAAYAISLRQQKRIAQSAEIWLAENPTHQTRSARFDAILLAPGGQARHIRQAFDASDLS